MVSICGAGDGSFGRRIQSQHIGLIRQIMDRVQKGDNPGGAIPSFLQRMVRGASGCIGILAQLHLLRDGGRNGRDRRGQLARVLRKIANCEISSHPAASGQEERAAGRHPVVQQISHSIRSVAAFFIG